MDAFHAFADTLFNRLAWTSAQAVLLVGAVCLVGRLVPKLPSATRSMLWWLLGVQLILGLAGAAPVELPLLSTAARTTVAAIASSRPVSAIAPEASPAPFAISQSQQASAHAVSPVSGVSNAANWRLALVCMWLGGVLLQLLLMAHDWRKAHAVLRNSTPLRDPVLYALCAEQSRALGLRHPPALRASLAIVSPQVTGIWRPTVLMPAGHNLTPQESSLALAHELMHLRRGDLWMCWVPAIAQRLFFFHPLVTWALREYALSREAACDAQVLRQAGASAQAYGHLLLRLGVARPVYRGLAGASPSFGNLKRRLIMLQQTDDLPHRRAHGWILVAIIALAGVLPYRVTASGASDAAVAPMHADHSAASQNASPPTPPLPPAPPAAADLGFNARHVDIDTHSDATRGLALFDGDAVTVFGNDSDLASIKRLRQTSDSPLLWFRRDDNKAYLIHDKAYVERASAAYAPMIRFRRQANQLEGRKWAVQGELEGLQSWSVDVDNQRREILRDGKDAPGATARLSSLEAQQREIASRMADLKAQQQALAPLLTEQARRQRQIAAQTDRQLSQLVDEAIGQGLAQEVSHR